MSVVVEPTYDWSPDSMIEVALSDCKMNEWWDKRYINRMAYGKAYEVVHAGLQNVKKSLN